MKWFKHDSNASRDKKLQNVIIDYGMEGYGLYWYCVELVAESIDGNNLTFELEHDSRIISNSTGISEQKVTELMRYFVEQNLFENSGNTITCLKLAKRLDETTSKNPYVKQMLNEIKGRGLVSVKKPLNSGVIPEGLRSDSGDSPDSLLKVSDQIRLDQIILDKKDQDTLVEEKSPTRTKLKKYKFSDNDLKFATQMFKKIKETNNATKKQNLESWAHDCRLMREREKISLNEYWRVFAWANNHHFWCKNIESPSKLRKQYPRLVKEIQDEQANTGTNKSFTGKAWDQSPAIAPYERILQNARDAGHDV